jgi:hypothetical protein
VPVAGSTAVAAQADDYRSGPRVGWVAIAAIIAAVVVGVWIAVDDDDDGEGALTRG